MAVTREDADQYIAELKQKFHDQPENYRQFCVALKKFMQQKIDYSTLMFIWMPLIKADQNLVVGLKKFLPKNCTLIENAISREAEDYRGEDDIVRNLQWRGKSYVDQVQVSANQGGNGAETREKDDFTDE